MKKLIFIWSIVFLLSLFSSYALIDSCTLNNPANNQYDSGVIKLNATVVWSSEATNTNASQVEFIIYTSSSTLRFLNDTSNGTKTNATAGALTIKGDFTVNLVNANLTDNQAYSAVASCYNSTFQSGVNAVNSSVATYTVDVIAPSTVITNPLSGSVVVPNNNIVTFEYTPTETNLGNCTLSLNNAIVKSSTSTSITPNVTSGVINRFTNNFGADNSSVRVAITCRDLAGLSGSSSNFTFWVLLGSSSVAIRQLQQSGGGVSGSFVASPSGFSPPSVPSIQEAETHLQKYAWIYVIIVFVLGVAAVKFKWFK